MEKMQINSLISKRKALLKIIKMISINIKLALRKI